MKKALLSVYAALISAMTWAQEGGGKDVNVNITSDEGGANWYSSPWLWIIGAAVFILLLVAITRGRSRD